MTGTLTPNPSPGGRGETFRILVADAISPQGRAVLAGYPDLATDERTGLPPAELAEIIGAYDGLIVRSATKVTAALLERAVRLKAVVRAGVGTDNIDVEAATRRGVLVMNTPAGNTVAAAEHTVGLLLALVRHIPAADRSVKEGRWERSRFVGVELRGKTLGVLGLGKIGREVARRARGLEMDVVAHDPFITADQAATFEVKLLPLDEVLAQCDVLTVHVPLTERTRHIIGEREISLMKQGVRIINCARGGIVDEAALGRALESGHVAGAALDVFEKEPPGPLPLVQSERVVATPHLGASTVEAQENVGTEAARLLASYLREGAIQNAVNTISVDASLVRELTPWRLLAERIGALQAQLTPPGARVKRVVLTFAGERWGENERGLLANAYLKGFLAPFLGEPVNEVNARHFAKELGFGLVEAQSSEAQGFSRLVEGVVETDGGRRQVSGTLFGTGPRIVTIDDFRTDAIPEGNLILISNDDRPGVIGGVGTVLGRRGINIANMFVGKSSAGRALGIFNLDQPVSGEVLAEITGVSGIVDVRQVRL